MMEHQPHLTSHDDLLDVLLAHKYRISLTSPPRQSYFRVVAVVFFSLVDNNGIVVHRDERHHVVGTNDEPHSIGGSICAERAALLQLRFIPNLDSITKIVIVTDNSDCVSPGMLCREFMASHDRIPWDVPILLGRSVCKNCGLSITGNACGDSFKRFDVDKDNFQKIQTNIFADCSATGFEESNHAKQYTAPHDFLGTVTSLRELFPYPSLYVRLTSREALQLGERYVETTTQNINDCNSSQRTDGDTADEKSEVSDEMTTKTTVDCSNNTQRSPQHELDAADLGAIPESHLTAGEIPIQRREKLLQFATKATAFETHQRHAHPIQYGAAVLFSDNTVSIATQKVAIEYGCTLDAVGQLASVIDRKSLQLDENNLAVRPILLVQCDQFGIAHPPFAQGRAFLTERGYGDCKILLHQQRLSRSHPTLLEGESLRNFEEEEDKQVDIKLIEVRADSLAPSPPDVFGVVKTYKMHS